MRRNPRISSRQVRHRRQGPRAWGAREGAWCRGEDTGLQASLGRGFIWHRLRPGGQRGAVALAGQHPPGLVSRLCRLPHLKAVGADSGKLLPVSAALLRGDPSGRWVTGAAGLRAEEFVQHCPKQCLFLRS